jgi:hypothetical protein
MSVDKELEDIVEVVTSRVVKTLYAQGFINVTRMRNEKIRSDFRKMRKQCVPVNEAIERLSDKDYHTRQGQAYRIGTDSVLKIVYKEIAEEKRK